MSNIELDVPSLQVHVTTSSDIHVNIQESPTIQVNIEDQPDIRVVLRQPNLIVNQSEIPFFDPVLQSISSSVAQTASFAENIAVISAGEYEIGNDVPLIVNLNIGLANQ